MNQKKNCCLKHVSNFCNKLFCRHTNYKTNYLHQCIVLKKTYILNPSTHIKINLKNYSIFCCYFHVYASFSSLECQAFYFVLNICSPWTCLFVHLCNLMHAATYPCFEVHLPDVVDTVVGRGVFSGIRTWFLGLSWIWPHYVSFSYLVMLFPLILMLTQPGFRSFTLHILLNHITAFIFS